jgi:hypothetical protein
MNEIAAKIKQELVKDGLIGQGAHFELRLTKRGLYICNQRQADGLYQKYVGLLEELMGQKMEANTSFELCQ